MNVSLTFDVKGRGFTSISKSMEAGLDRAVRLAAMKIEKECRQSILTGAKTGRIYRRGKVEHQASAPGEAPANDMGNLAASLGWRPKGRMVAEAGTIKGKVALVASYAQGLEFGTRRVEPRPFLRPAVAKVRPSFLKACEVAMRRA